ncbi:outer membrane beta-barrel protein [Algivirga pacifica]|uniref:Outer membrane protein beta-barrel domain-containing protein n=1 Tax=Algivirga pacifica TaxID=1162670 RepID=A0ABP9DKR8_9BACT
MLSRILLINLIALTLTGIHAYGQMPASIPGNLYIDFGPAFFSENPDDIRLETQSRGVNITYLYKAELGESKFSFNPGLGYGHESYFFKNQETIQDTGDQNVILNINDQFDISDFKKSKLAVNYIDIPLELHYRSNPGINSFLLGIGIKGGVRFNTHTKIKLETDNDDLVLQKVYDDFNVRRFRLGAMARIGYGRFHVFGYYGLVPLFTEKAFEGNNNDHPIFFGISLSRF